MKFTRVNNSLVLSLNGNIAVLTPVVFTELDMIEIKINNELECYLQARTSELNMKFAYIYASRALRGYDRAWQARFFYYVCVKQIVRTIYLT